MTIKDFRYDGGKKLNLKDVSTSAGEEKDHKAELIHCTEANIMRACELQEKLYAEGREGLIIAIQARDAAGKDSLIKKVFSSLNPAALEVHSFKSPNSNELAHDYLWRINAALPVRGKIGVFNRSQYEDVLVVKVHHMEKNYRMPSRCTQDDDFFSKRYRQIRNWEQYLYENGYRMVKLFLNVSRAVQKERFLERIERDEKHWKLSTADMAERAAWDEYDKAYEDCINHTGTQESPWYVVPADTKWYTRYLVSQILVDTLEEMHPEYPGLDPEEAAKIPVVMQQLEEDGD
ncbi:MAG: polyphosphate kinase 2 family protein [Clostridia bacterium]|nr:polyphosphate kinase 2 family protein [Clostridia bacterium]